MGAAEAYTQLASELLEVGVQPASVPQLVEDVKTHSIVEKRALDLLATLLCNTALCYFSLNKIQETEALCTACLTADPYNYKAVYYLAQCALAEKRYTEALKYVERCQNIVDAKKLDKKTTHPHAALVKKISASMDATWSAVRGISTCDELITNIAEGTAITLNLQKLNCHSKAEVIKQQVLPKLVKIIKQKAEYSKHADIHSGIWSSIHQLLYKVEPKVEAEMVAQLKGALESHSIDILKYAKDILTTVEHNPSIATSLQPILVQLSKCCADLKTTQALETLLTMLEKCKYDMELDVLKSIWYYFINIRTEQTPVVDNHFTSLLNKMIVTLMVHLDLDAYGERRNHIEGCLTAIFLKRFGKYEIYEDTLAAIVTRVFNGYITSCDVVIAGKAISQVWYRGLRCLYASNRYMFKAYIISNGIMAPLLNNYLDICGYGAEHLELMLLVSEVMVLSMDFVECRQQILEADVKGASITEFVNNDVGCIKYLEEIRRRDPELKEYCKRQKFEFKDVAHTDMQAAFYHYKILLLSKLMVHSTTVKKRILEHIDLFYLVPRTMVALIKDGCKADALVDAMSYITLHEEAKTVDMIDFIYVQLRWAESSEQCKGLMMYMTCQTVANILRSRDDRHGYHKTTGKHEMWDENQMDLLRKAYDKLPDASKPASNGEYNEGNLSKANEIRESILTLNNDMARCLISVVKRIAKQNAEESETHLYNIIQLRSNANADAVVLEALHYLTLHNVNKPLLQSAGVLRILIDTANNDMYKGTNAGRYISQSIAHMCIASNPQILSYRDALDAVGPLVKLLSDDHELFQYEAALGLTNLLTIDDDVRTRVWSVNGWQALGNLLSSDNAKLKAACLEGWCNLAAGEDVVHGHFYKMLAQQMEAAEDPAKLITLDIHDISILLLFAGDVTDLRCVTASTGTLALLVRDLRIANFSPFFAKINNLFAVIDKLDNADVLYRVLTALSCIMQGNLKNISPVNEAHVKTVKQRIQQSTRRNLTKFKTPELLDLAKEIMDCKVD